MQILKSTNSIKLNCRSALSAPGQKLAIFSTSEQSDVFINLEQIFYA